MVSKKIIVIVLLVFFIQNAAPKLLWATEIENNFTPNPFELRIVWKNAENSSTSCKRLIEFFLNELRATTNDRKIELDVEKASAGTTKGISVECIKPETLEQIAVHDPSRAEEPLRLHFLEKAMSFDAADWLKLQQDYLREKNEISLAPSLPKLTTENENTALSAIEKVETKTSTTKGAIFQQWWFWAIVAGVGASAFAISQAAKGSRDSSINVEIR